MDRTTTRGAVGRVTAAAVAVALVGAVSPVGAARPLAGASLTNLDHLDFLTDHVAPPGRPRHTTFRLAQRPRIGVLWTYSEPQPDGSYNRIGGGAYDPATNTYEQGAYNADDISRAAVVYLRHWRQTGSMSSRRRAVQLLRGLTYLQTATGPNRGNVVLWMQPNGALNRSPVIVELPDPSDSGPSYWLGRTMWALGEGYRAFKDVRPGFARFLGERMDLAIDALDRQVLAPRFGERVTADGLRWPAWLLVDGADASSEPVYGLAAYVEAGGGERARRALAKLAGGIAAMNLGGSRTWPFKAIMPWTRSRSVWHAWAGQMAGALVRAADALNRPALARTAVAEAGSFTPHMLIQNGPEQGWLPGTTDRSQIAYGTDSTLQNLLRTASVAGRRSFRELAGVAAAWYFGNNPAGESMYDPATGRTFDGISSDDPPAVNRNSGAESTIHGLLSMLALDAHPRVAARARIASRDEQTTWRYVEAEAGSVVGGEVVTPEEEWTGESLWGGGSYVELGDGGSVSIPVDLPVGDRYHLYPVYDRRPFAAGVAGLRYALGAAPAGGVDHGGAGRQGVTATRGYRAVGHLVSATSVPSGTTSLVVSYAGDGTRPARLDAVMVQPEVEWLLLGGQAGGQALLRSFSETREARPLVLAGTGPMRARSYDARGRLIRSAVVPSGGRVRIEPGGFTYVTR